MVLTIDTTKSIMGSKKGQDMARIEVKGDSTPQKVEVKRRKYNSRGTTVDKLAITLPKTLNQTINGIAVRDNKSRSMVIAELIEKGLNSNE